MEILTVQAFCKRPGQKESLEIRCLRGQRIRRPFLGVDLQFDWREAEKKMAMALDESKVFVLFGTSVQAPGGWMTSLGTLSKDNGNGDGDRKTEKRLGRRRGFGAKLELVKLSKQDADDNAKHIRTKT